MNNYPKPGRYRTSFSDDEIVQAMRDNPPPHQRQGNLWAFIDALPAPERQRLEKLAGIKRNCSDCN